MGLERKIFGFGIYGALVTSLNKEEFKEALTLPHVEVVAHSEIEKLRHKFTLKPLKTISKIADIKDNNYIRIDTSAWRDFIFGPGNTFRSKEYFQLVDHLLHLDDFVNTTKIRANLQIAPKTMYYLCKKLKELNIIEEKKIGHQQLIKLKSIQGRKSKNKPWCEKLFKDNDLIEDLPKTSLYNNLSPVDQVKLYLMTFTAGVDSKILYEKMGMKIRTGLKILQKICSEEPENFCMISEISHKSSICKFYHNPIYKEVIKKRIERIKGAKTAPGSLSTISTYEKELALKTLAEKYGTFNMNKEILSELLEMTGWAYSFDRKTLLNAARSAGLYVSRNNQSAGSKYTISKDPLQERPDSLDKTKSVVLDSHAVMANKIKNIFLINSSFVKMDNGFSSNSWCGLRELFYFIMNRLSHERSYSLKNLTAQIPVHLFYKIKPFNKPNFKYEIAFNLWRRNKKRFDPLGEYFKSDALFIKDEKGEEYIDPSVYEVDKKIDQLTMQEYLGILPSKYLSVISTRSSTSNIKKILEKLKKNDLIRFQDHEEDVVIIKGSVEDAPSLFSKRISKANDKQAIEYNIRKHLYYELLQCNPESFEDDAKYIIMKRYAKREAEIFLFKIFKIKTAEKHSAKKEYSLLKEDRDMYLEIKRALISNTLEFLMKYDMDRIERVVGYLVHKRIVSSRKANPRAGEVALSVKFCHFFQKYTRIYEDGLAVKDPLYDFYFDKIFSKVKDSRSIDMDALLEKCRYIEDFELTKFFNLYRDIFELRSLDDFILISLKSEKDPFLDK